jgi:hypothetical protein
MRHLQILILVIVVAGVPAVLTGCKDKVPPLSNVVKAVSMPTNVIDDFEDGNRAMNPALYGATHGDWTLYGSASLVYLTSPYIVPNTAADAVNSSAFAFHASGTLRDNGDGKYPEATLWARFNVEPWYSISGSGFTGLRYKLNVSPADTAPKRRFKLRVSDSVPLANGGICSYKDIVTGVTCDCWNHFGADFTVTAGWQQYDYTFDQLTQEAWGCKWVSGPPWRFSGGLLTATPPRPPGYYYDYIFGFDFCESRDNSIGLSQIDFWVDDVEFY